MSNGVPMSAEPDQRWPERIPPGGLGPDELALLTAAEPLTGRPVDAPEAGR